MGGHHTEYALGSPALVRAVHLEKALLSTLIPVLLRRSVSLVAESLEHIPEMLLSEIVDNPLVAAITSAQTITQISPHLISFSMNPSSMST